MQQTPMEIIAHIDVKVKIEREESIPAEDAFSQRYGAKWESKKRKAKEVAERMRQIGEPMRAMRMENCAEVVSGRVCQSCGQMHVTYANLCRDRFCPVCKWRLSMKRFSMMYTIVEGLRNAYPESAWQFVTLTAKNCRPNELKNLMDEMSRVWNNITTSKKFQGKVAGWARSTEITYNPKTGELHPHYHILVMYHECLEPDEYIVERWCKGMTWKTSKLAQCAEQIEWGVEEEKEIGWKVDRNPEDEAAIEAILETFKYSTKDSDIDNMPVGTFWYMTRALANRRLVSFGGLIKEYAQACEATRLDEITEEDEADIEAKMDKCIKCASRDLIEVLGKWSGDTYIWRRKE